jgi:nucleotide-binding universal stress UspA family protein
MTSLHRLPIQAACPRRLGQARKACVSIGGRWQGLREGQGSSLARPLHPLVLEADMPFKIVAAVDQSEYADVVLEHAFDQANRHDDAEVHVVSVIDRADGADRILRVELAQRVLRTLESFARGAATPRIWLHVRVGRPAEEIANLGAEVESDLIVVGRFGAHRRRGSVADDVLRQVIGPVLVVQLKDYDATTKLLQCPGCVTVRRESDGERWFCDAHRGVHSLNASLLLPHEHWGLGDGLKW